MNTMHHFWCSCDWSAHVHVHHMLHYLDVLWLIVFFGVVVYTQTPYFTECVSVEQTVSTVEEIGNDAELHVVHMMSA